MTAFVANSGLSGIVNQGALAKHSPGDSRQSSYTENSSSFWGDFRSFVSTGAEWPSVSTKNSALVLYLMAQ